MRMVVAADEAFQPPPPRGPSLPRRAVRVRDRHALYEICLSGVFFPVIQ